MGTSDAINRLTALYVYVAYVFLLLVIDLFSGCSYSIREIQQKQTQNRTRCDHLLSI